MRALLNKIKYKQHTPLDLMTTCIYWLYGYCSNESTQNHNRYTNRNVNTLSFHSLLRTYKYNGQHGILLYTVPTWMNDLWQLKCLPYLLFPVIDELDDYNKQLLKIKFINGAGGGRGSEYLGTLKFKILLHLILIMSKHLYYVVHKIL